MDIFVYLPRTDSNSISNTLLLLYGIFTTYICDHKFKSMALFQGFAITLIIKSRAKNFQAAFERFADTVRNLGKMLRQVSFL